MVTEYQYMTFLSVPFSSGCALRPAAYVAARVSTCNSFQFPSHRDVLCDPDACMGMREVEKTFSSLLIGMCFATIRAEQLHWLDAGLFQFPSHRDVLCDLKSVELAELKLKSFSSLLIGMCFATPRDGPPKRIPDDFQFPSHRDVLCDTSRSS